MMNIHPDIYRRIVNAKSVLERAEQYLKRPSDIDVSVALLLMHDAVELLMIAVLDHVQAPANKRREFLDFWPEIKKAGRPEAPDFIPMDSLNRLRVVLKHSGNIPHPDNVRELFPRTKGFFENVLRIYCSINYDEVSLYGAIANDEVKSFIRSAREKFASGEKADAMVELAKATIALERPRDSHVPKLTAPQAPSVTRELREAGFDRYLQQVHSFLEGSAAITNAQTFGYNPFDYQAFKGVLPTVLVSLGGAYQAQLWHTYDDLSKDDFDVLVAFLVDLSLKIGEAYQPVRPSIEDSDVIGVSQRVLRAKLKANGSGMGG
jgi:hypothetical protein